MSATNMWTVDRSDIDEEPLYTCAWCESGVLARDMIMAWTTRKPEYTAGKPYRTQYPMCFDCAMVGRCDGCDSINLLSEMQDGLCKECQGAN